MKNELSQKWALPPSWLRLLIIILLLLGIFFRFVNLDRKVYWGDETYTSVAIAGYRWSEYAQVLDGRKLSIEELQKYQRTNSERSFIDTLNAIALEQTDHPPLYYIIARLWVQTFGNSVAVTRSLSVLFSLLVFPSIYWLCLELFEFSLTAWIAIALVAVSPFHLLYAQEAREYSLLTVTILLSSAALLRAIRIKTKTSWGIYSLTVVLGLYLSLFSSLVTIGQGIYVIVTEGFRVSKTVVAYFLTSFAVFLLFMPWIWVIITNFSFIQGSIEHKSQKISLLSLVSHWAANLTRIFWDVQLGLVDPFEVKFGFDQPVTYFIVPIWMLVGYSIVFLCRQSPKKVYWFVLTLVGVTGLTLSLSDLLKGGILSTIPRYLIPCYLGIELAVAYLISKKIYSNSITIQQQKLWQIIAIILITGSVLSCVNISQAETWWTKRGDYYNPPIVNIINQSKRPLVLIDNPFRVLSLSYLLDKEVKTQVLLDPENIPKISDGFSDVFVYTTYARSGKLRNRLEEKLGKLELIYKADASRDISLWKMKK